MNSNRYEDQRAVDRLLKDAHCAVAYGQPGVAQKTGLDDTQLTKLYDSRLSQMLELVRIIGPCTFPGGTAGSEGFVNPACVYNEFLDMNALRYLTREEQDMLRAAISDMSVLWEGKRCVQGMPLAYNALIRAVLRDDNLFFSAYGAAREHLIECSKAIGDGYGAQACHVYRRQS